MITKINEERTLTKHISCGCECKFDGTKCNSSQKWSNDKCRCKKQYLWNPATCSCKNGKYLANIMDDSVITCDKNKEPYDEETKTVPAGLNEKKYLVKH